jgi:hypothetical protein
LNILVIVIWCIICFFSIAKENVQVISDQNDAQVDQSLASALKEQQWKTTLGSTMAHIL